MKIIGINDENGIFTACDRMATEIVEILKYEGSCNPADLKEKGFADGEIEQHWRMAYGLAKIELNWMDAA